MISPKSLIIVFWSLAERKDSAFLWTLTKVNYKCQSEDLRIFLQDKNSLNTTNDKFRVQTI